MQWLIVLLALALTACGSNDSDNNSGNTNNETVTTAAPQDTQEPASETDTQGPAQSFGQPGDDQIRPGVLIQAMGSECTSNFIYTDNVGNYYIGAAAHCFSPDANNGVDPCQARNEAIGIDVVIENAAFTGTLVYSSWETMKQDGETPGSGICQGNDFALVKIDARDLDNIHPAARVFQGPTALLKGTAAPGDEVFTYGQSQFSLSQSKTGTITNVSTDGWLYEVDLSSPAVPGDSGSAVLHESGQALGVLSTLNACIGLCPLTSNGVVNLDMALAYANAEAFDSKLRLVTWSVFSP